jgi:signal transduction histidine kinase/CheY-like chemotaxis protein
MKSSEVELAILAEAGCPEITARAILDAAPIGLAVIGVDECYRYANAQLEARRGTALVGRTLRETLGAAAYIKVRPHIRAVLSGRSVAFKLPAPAHEARNEAEATYIWLQPMFGPTRAVTGFISQELELADLDRFGPRGPSVRTMEAVARLAAGLVHDFHNLAQAILGGARMVLRRCAGDEAQRRPAEELCETAMRATQLSAQLLAFAGKQALHPTLVDLNECFRRQRRVLERAAGPSVSVELYLDAALDRSWRVWIDAVQLERVLLNLVVNARDAMPRGGRLILATRALEPGCESPLGAAGSDGRSIAITVSDDGVGMDEETLAAAFEPFFTTKPAAFGTGLGLSTAYGIVHATGGTIRAGSEPGRGTTVEIVLPARFLEVTEPSERAPSPPARAAAQLQRAVDAMRSVLVLEDNSCTRLAIATLLREAGYRVLTAPSAADAERLSWDPASEHAVRPDVAVIDLGLPDESGCVFAARLRARFPGLPVVFMSGDPDREDVVAPGDVFLAKPFELDELERLVRMLDARAGS